MAETKCCDDPKNLVAHPGRPGRLQCQVCGKVYVDFPLEPGKVGVTLRG